MFQALSHPQVGMLLVLIFAQQIAFGGFEQLLSLFTLNRLGLNASGNAIIFVFVGIIVVAVQGGLIGPWSRKYGDRKLIFIGLALLADRPGADRVDATPCPCPVTPRQAAGRAERQRRLPHPREPNHPQRADELPDDGNNGWLGLAWILVAMMPASIGGGVLQPSINSLITKRIEPDEIGGMLGISAALLSAANAIAPLIGGAIFQALGAPPPSCWAGPCWVC